MNQHPTEDIFYFKFSMNSSTAWMMLSEATIAKDSPFPVPLMTEPTTQSDKN